MQSVANSLFVPVTLLQLLSVRHFPAHKIIHEFVVQLLLDSEHDCPDQRIQEEFAITGNESVTRSTGHVCNSWEDVWHKLLHKGRDHEALIDIMSEEFSCIPVGIDDFVYYSLIKIYFLFIIY